MMPTAPSWPSAALAEALALRYGSAIAQTVLAALGLGASQAPVDEATLRQAIRMADDAETVMAGVAFASLPRWSALTEGPRLQRVAQRAGVSPDALDLLDRLRLDGMLARCWLEAGPVSERALDDLLLGCLTAWRRTG